MVEIQYKIHDEFAVEFKQRFLVRRKVQKNVFVLNTWFFIPNSLDINPQLVSTGRRSRKLRVEVAGRPH